MYTQSYIFSEPFKKFLRDIVTFYPEITHNVFPKNKGILLHNYNVIIMPRKLSLNILYSPYSEFPLSQ